MDAENDISDANSIVPQGLCLKCKGYLGIVICPTEAGDQWTVPEMRLSACVGIGLGKTILAKPPFFLILSLLVMYKTT
jgi:hypothetical protein